MIGVINYETYFVIITNRIIDQQIPAVYGFIPGRTLSMKHCLGLSLSRKTAGRFSGAFS